MVKILSISLNIFHVSNFYFVCLIDLIYSNINELIHHGFCPFLFSYNIFIILIFLHTLEQLWITSFLVNWSYCNPIDFFSWQLRLSSIIHILLSGKVSVSINSSYTNNTSMLRMHLSVCSISFQDYQKIKVVFSSELSSRYFLS